MTTQQAGFNRNESAGERDAVLLESVMLYAQRHARFPDARSFRHAHEQEKSRLEALERLGIIDYVFSEGFAPTLRVTIKAVGQCRSEIRRRVEEDGNVVLEALQGLYGQPHGTAREWSVAEIAEQCGLAANRVAMALTLISDLPVWSSCDRNRPDGMATAIRLNDGVMREPSFSEVVERFTAAPLPGPPDPDEPANALDERHRALLHDCELSHEEEDRLVEHLTECIAIKDDIRRKLVLKRLPPKISNQIEDHPSLMVEVTSIVHLCAVFPGGLLKLRDAIHRFEDDSRYMRNVDEYLRQIALRRQSEQSPRTP